MRICGRGQKGFSLLEMLIAMVIAIVIIGGVYRTFTVQQKTFVVQEQVSEVQQSVRSVMDFIARDLRMAGFGRASWQADPITITVGPNPSPNRRVTLDLVGAFGGPIALLGNPANMGQQQIVLDRDEVLDANGNLLVFEQYYDSDTDGNPLSPPIPSIRYTNMVVWSPTGEGGSDTIEIDGDGSTGGRDGLDIDLRADAHDDFNRQIYSQVYLVETMSYDWMESTGELRRNGSVLATHVQDFQVANLNNGSFQVHITIDTRTNDPDFPQGRRQRTLTSTIRARNVSVS